MTVAGGGPGPATPRAYALRDWTWEMSRGSPAPDGTWGNVPVDAHTCTVIERNEPIFVCEENAWILRFREERRHCI